MSCQDAFRAERRSRFRCGSRQRRPRSRPRRALWAVAALSLVVLAGAISVLVWRNRSAGPTAPVPTPFTAIPLTAYPGREQQPSFSPDGNSVAFAWNGEAEENWDIYVKLVGPGSPQRRTTDPASSSVPLVSRGARRAARADDAVSPSWSPLTRRPRRQVLRSAGWVCGPSPRWSADSRFRGAIAQGAACHCLDVHGSARPAASVRRSPRTHRSRTGS